jgi:MFS family permease
MQQEKKGIRTFAFTGYMFMTVVICSGVSVIVPVIPNIMREQGISAGFITAAFVSLLTGRFLSSIFTGMLLLKVRPQHLLYSSFVLHLCTMVLLVFAKGGIVFTALRFAEGIFEGIVSVVLQVIVIAMSTPEDRGIKMGYMQSAFGVGFIVGPMIGSLSMRQFGSSGVFGAVALLMVVCILWLTLIFRSLSENIKQAPPQKISFNLEFVRFIPYYSAPILQRVLVVAFAMLIPLYLVDKFQLAAHQIGYFFTLSAIITSITMPLTGRLGKSSYCNYFVVAAMVVMGISILAMGFTSSPILFTASFITETLGFAVMAPNSMKIFGDIVAEHPRRGEIVGTSSSFRELLNIVLSFTLIPLYQFRMSLPWMLLSVMCLLLAIPYLRGGRAERAELATARASSGS